MARKLAALHRARAHIIPSAAARQRDQLSIREPPSVSRSGRARRDDNNRRPFFPLLRLLLLAIIISETFHRVSHRRANTVCLLDFFLYIFVIFHEHMTKFIRFADRCFALETFTATVCTTACTRRTNSRAELK